MIRRTSLYGEASLRGGRQPWLSCWMEFRLWLPVIAPLSAVVAAGVAFVPVSPRPPHATPDSLLLYSGCLSLVWTLLVLLSYKHIIPWRRHPSYLLLQRVINSLVFTIVILAKELNKDNSQCALMACMLQFSLLAGELWLAALSVDLYQCLTDPFMAYAINQRRYTIGVYLVSLISSLCLAGGVGSCQGTFKTTAGISLCWIENDQFGSCFVFYFLLWLVAFNVLSVGVGVFTFSRLSNGLTETYATRRAVVTTTFRILISYLCYGLLLATLYLATPHAQGASELFAFFVGLRGFYDSFIWFALHNFKNKKKLCGSVQRDSEATRERRTPLINSGPGRETRTSRVSFAAILLDTDGPDSAEDAPDADVTDDADDDDGYNRGQDDVDLTPQLNQALRKELLLFVTSGIRESVLRWNARDEEHAIGIGISVRTTSRKTSSSRGDSDDGSSGAVRSSVHIGQSIGRSIMSTAAALLGLARQPGEDPSPHRQGRVDSNASSAAQWRHTSMMGHLQQQQQQQQQQQAPLPEQVVFDLVFDLDGEQHRFVDFRPATFALLREMAGFTSQRYLGLMAQPVRELLEHAGGSAAFQFQCGRGEILVKTVSRHEANVLRSRLDKYLEHLRLHPSSLLVRFLGLHTLTLFGREFYFVVMRNVFPNSINERYDIKGSWIGRNAAALVPGSRQICRKCSETFFQGDVSSACTVGVHGHEANVVFKDNDLQNKIRLRSEDVWNVIETLHSDSDCLASMGIMDYSLLIGVKNKEYDLELASSGGANESRPSLTPSNGILGPASSDDRASNVSTADTVINLHSSCLGPPERLRILLAGAGGGAASEPDLSGDSFSRDSDFMAIAGVGPVLGGGGPGEAGFGIAMLEGFPARSIVAPESYHLGIVDILQDWSWSKRIEHFFRVYLRQQPAEGISCAPPEPYRVRFQARIARTFDHSLFVRQVTGAWSGQTRFLSQPEPLHHP